MSNKDHTVKVDVIAEPGAALGDVIFRLNSELKNDEEQLVFDQDRDEMRKLDDDPVEFELDDRTDLDLQFARKKDAFWVVMGPDSTTDPPYPKQPSYSDEIYAVDVDKHKLTVRNENNTVAKFAYSLGFVTRNGSKVRFD